MKHRGHIGKVTHHDGSTFHGKVMGISQDISFCGATAEELLENFQKAVDHYCTKTTTISHLVERKFLGKFGTRFTPETHRRLFLRSRKEKVPMMAIINRAVESYLDEVEKQHES